MKPVATQLENYLIENQARFYRLAYSYLQNREEALDAVQTAICRALEKRGSLRNAAMLRSWFTRILINTCLDMLRQKKRVTPTAPAELNPGSYEDPLPADELLLGQLNALPPEEQTVVKLRFFEDLSLKEIAEITEANLNTVKTRLYNALKKLRISLEEAASE